MKLSTHYYILSLSDETSRLYEGFRDDLIDIQNTAFPFRSKPNGAPPGTGSVSGDPPLPGTELNEKQLRDFLQQTDLRFAKYFGQDPLGLVLVGLRRFVDPYTSLTRHRDVIIGMVEGDFRATSPHDLGKIVWPVLKHAIAGSTGNALRSLASADNLRNVVSGIDKVWMSAESNPESTLYVEDGYHLNTSEPGKHNTNPFPDSVALRDVFDNVVDIIIEKILRGGGAVVFMENDSLISRERIAMIVRG